MDLRDIEIYVRLRVVPKRAKLLRDFIVVQESKFIFPYYYPLIQSRLAVQVIVFTQVMLIQYLIYHFTSLATEYFVLQCNVVIRTVLPAMIAGKMCTGM